MVSQEHIYRTTFITKNPNLYPHQRRITLYTLLWDTLYVLQLTGTLSNHNNVLKAKIIGFLLTNFLVIFIIFHIPYQIIQLYKIDFRFQITSEDVLFDFLSNTPKAWTAEQTQGQIAIPDLCSPISKNKNMHHMKIHQIALLFYFSFEWYVFITPGQLLHFINL